MALTINTNIVSINAQRNLGLSGSQLGVSMQRLSSGLRVNSAKDDAAGLAIAERMSAQAKGLAVAARNANDGISLAQTAEGALGKMGDMLQRMRELAVQASNATNSEDDRNALQAEVSQLRSEIDRVAKTTTFNNQKILDGSFAGGVFQVGAGAGDNITVGGITNAKASALSNISYAERTFTVASNGMDMTGDSNLEIKGYATAVEKDVLQIRVGGANAEPVKLDALDSASSVQERLGQVVAAINAKTADTGVTAFMQEKNGSYEVTLLSEKVDANGQPETVELLGFADKVTGFGVAAVDVSAATSQAGADTTLHAAMKGAAWTTAADVLSVANATAAPTSDQFKAVKSNQAGIESLDVSTQAGAWKALKHIDDAIDQVNSARADLGALQTRFEKSIENIDIMNENISAARGRIVDADFASETAALSRTQILQQAGTAMVAQANQLPQQVLSLLQ
ncbi:flagellin [Comamonas kerstersii]|uniref:flagellin N-terminal helical domain-containing protein n=1 Tax=Comamonas kerstersii TaxID=225992 RepID=UPI0026DDBD22|nr:flagellin [Comamonas kerstersii]